MISRVAMEVQRSFAASLKSDIDGLVDAVATGFSQLEAEEPEWRTQKKLVPRQWPGKVKLDVGGRKFFTTMPVLFAREGFFRALSEGVGAVERGCRRVPVHRSKSACFQAHPQPPVTPAGPA